MPSGPGGLGGCAFLCILPSCSQHSGKPGSHLHCISGRKWRKEFNSYLLHAKKPMQKKQIVSAQVQKLKGRSRKFNKKKFQIYTLPSKKTHQKPKQKKNNKKTCYNCIGSSISLGTCLCHLFMICYFTFIGHLLCVPGPLWDAFTCLHLSSQ